MTLDPRQRLWTHLSEVPSSLPPGVVTIGNFDGVHVGHRRLVERVREVAQQRGLSARALTFHPHPRHVIGQRSDLELITGYSARNTLLLQAGIDEVLDLKFTRDFAALSPEDFVRTYLVDLLHAAVVVMGRDSRFGCRNCAGFDDMVALGRAHGFETLTVEELLEQPRSGQRVSSSRIRERLRDGDVRTARAMLGRPHFVADTVCHGFKRGRELGFPTANFGPHPQGLVPADGVYAGYFTITDPSAGIERFPATISVGTNPTFETGPLHRVVETYVHGSHDYDLYDLPARVEFIGFLRPTRAFENLESLIKQMHDDVAVTHSTLEALPAHERGRSC